MARLIPVVDILGGQVVRAVGGRRAEYRPVDGDSDPATVARRLVERASANTLYVADLDAITGAHPPTTPGWAVDGTTLWLDAGVRTAYDLDPLSGVVPVLGSETMSDPERLARQMFIRLQTGVLSLDLRGHELLGLWRPGVELLDRTACLIDVFSEVCRTVLLLDLTAVGEGSGVGSAVLYLLERHRSDFPLHEFVVGGGVRDRDDVSRLADAGADAVLVASALHDGTLTLPRPAP